jgi:hypothetical protein
MGLYLMMPFIKEKIGLLYVTVSGDTALSRLLLCYAIFKQVEELYSLDVDSLSELR